MNYSDYDPSKDKNIETLGKSTRIGLTNKSVHGEKRVYGMNTHEVSKKEMNRFVSHNDTISFFELLNHDYVKNRKLTHDELMKPREKTEMREILQNKKFRFTQQQMEQLMLQFGGEEEITLREVLKKAKSLKMINRF